MRVLLLLATAWALAPITTPPKRTEFREGIGGATKEQAVAVGETVDCAKKPIGPRDVVIRCYDISSDGKLAPALSLATSKRGVDPSGLTAEPDPSGLMADDAETLQVPMPSKSSKSPPMFRRSCNGT